MHGVDGATCIDFAVEKRLELSLVGTAALR
ncbi:hypothetical protein N601_17175 [Rhodococcus erythropolis DN1]|nr:hypothetical protein N601_17175 [Rhodococcus erythropolis DN1]